MSGLGLIGAESDSDNSDELNDTTLAGPFGSLGDFDE